MLQSLVYFLNSSPEISWNLGMKNELASKMMVREVVK